jgi:hypothetical protein
MGTLTQAHADAWQEKFILAQPEIWWDMYHDRSTFSHVNWSEEDTAEYRGGLETKEGVHAVCPFRLFSRLHPSGQSLICRRSRITAQQRRSTWNMIASQGRKGGRSPCRRSMSSMVIWAMWLMPLNPGWDSWGIPPN